MTKVAELWNSRDPRAWTDALSRYWDYVQPANLMLERELEKLDLESLKRLDALGWYHFLLQKYFRWKNTAKNRYATTTRSLRRYADEDRLDDLNLLKLSTGQQASAAVQHLEARLVPIRCGFAALAVR